MKVAVTGGTGSWDRGVGPVVIKALEAAGPRGHQYRPRRPGRHRVARLHPRRSDRLRPDLCGAARPRCRGAARRQWRAGLGPSEWRGALSHQHADRLQRVSGRLLPRHQARRLGLVGNRAGLSLHHAADAVADASTRSADPDLVLRHLQGRDRGPGAPHAPRLRHHFRRPALFQHLLRHARAM